MSPIVNPLKHSFESTRPSPGPGFESRAVAAAMIRARRRRRARVGAASAAAAAVLAGVVVLIARTPAGGEPLTMTARERASDATAEPAVEGPLPTSDTARQIAGGAIPAADDYAELPVPARRRGQVDAIALDLKKREIKLTAEIEVIELELAAALSQQRPDRGTIKTKVRERSRLIGELELARIMAWLEVKALVGERHARPPSPPKPTRDAVEGPWDSTLNPFAGADDAGAAAPDRRRGTLAISAVPAARVYIDGRRIGTTPVSRRLAPGTYRVMLRYASGHTSHRSVRVKPGETVRIADRQSPAPLERLMLE